MKILLLSDNLEIANFLRDSGDEVTMTMDNLTGELDYDFIISYGYRHILKKPVLDKFKDRAINLHISYLPWNRGADPNLWSFIDGSPKGVTIHFIDEGIDTGDIICQRYMKYDFDDTLRTFYDKLIECMNDLFKKTWKYIRAGEAKRYPQTTCHTSADKEQYSHLLLDKGWDTPIKEIIRRAK